MANRYPLIIDAADKKLKELSVNDNLRVDGDIITQGNVIGDVIGDVTGNLTGDVTGTLTGNLTGDVNGNLTGDVTGTLTGDLIGNVTGNVFADDGTLLVNSADGTISYNVLINTPLIPTDISQLTDNQGLLDNVGGGADTFLELTDTPNVYSFGANRFIKVNNNETAVEYGEVSQSDIELALGYTPYDGASNPLGFIDSENDTLDSVVQRGNNTNFSISVNGISSSSLISNNITTRNFLEFFDNNETNQFDILIETNKTLSIANRLSIDTDLDTVNILNSQFLGDTNSSIGSINSPWENIYSNNLTIGTMRNQTSSAIFFESQENIEFFLGGSNKKTKVTGIGTFQLPTMTTAERNTLTPEEGDMIYNFDASSVQIYVGITAWTNDPNNPEPIPGWINLYTPPPPPEED